MTLSLRPSELCEISVSTLNAQSINLQTDNLHVYEHVSTGGFAVQLVHVNPAFQ